MRLIKLAFVSLVCFFSVVSLAGLPEAIVKTYIELKPEKIGTDLAKIKAGIQKLNHLDEAAKYAKARQGVSVNGELLANPSFLRQYTENLSDQLQVAWRKEALDLIAAGKKANATGKSLPEGITGWQKDIINGATMERMKPFKIDGQQFVVNSQKELEAILSKQNIPQEFWKHYRINAKNNIEVDILSATPNRFLGDHKFDNYKSAEAIATMITYYLKNGGKTDPESMSRFIHFASDVVHKKWLSRNHEYASPDQLKAFDELSRPEAAKDIVMVDAGFDVIEKSQLSFLNERVASLDQQIAAFSKDSNRQKALFSLRQDRARYSKQIEALRAKITMEKIKAPEAGVTGTSRLLKKG